MTKSKLIRFDFYFLIRIWNALDTFFAELFKPIAFLKGRNLN